MKKLICAVLCLMILSLSVAAVAEPVITKEADWYWNRNKLRVTVIAYGAPAKSGYYSSASISLTVTYKRGPSMSNAGSTYTQSSYVSANGGWGQGTKDIMTHVDGKNSGDIYVSKSVYAKYQYYGIR